MVSLRKGERVDQASMSVVIVVLVINVAGLLSLAIAITVGVISRYDGASVPAAILRAGAAFGGTLSLLTALLSMATKWLA